MSEPLPQPRFLPCGDAAVTVEFGMAIDPQISARVLALDGALNAAKVPGLIETVPTYRSLMVQFDPLILDYDGSSSACAAWPPRWTSRPSADGGGRCRWCTAANSASTWRRRRSGMG